MNTTGTRLILSGELILVLTALGVPSGQKLVLTNLFNVSKIIACFHLWQS